MKKRFLLLLALLTTTFGFSQECGALMTPLSIQDRSNEATRIIEGTVTASNSYWDVDKKNIYTVHTITAYKSFKGQTNTMFNVVTMGGQVGTSFQLTSSAAKLRIGMQGVFFLKDFRNRIAVSGNLYELVGAAQGVIKYNAAFDKASDIFTRYSSIENQLYPLIRRATGNKETTIQKRAANDRNSPMKANPIIYSFSPLTATAGTQTVLTITGTNFGSTTGTMSFSNANDGGASYTAAADAEILSWTNTQIEVEIPYLAGTGTLQITHNDGSTHQTSVPLTIEYSHNNLYNAGLVLPLALQDVDGNGGYTFAYHTDFNSSSAKTYFEEAFGLWNCESNLNFSFGNTTTTDESISDGINIVRFDNGSELASGVLGSVTTRFTSYCPTTNRVNVDEIDITWNDDTNWYYGSGSPSASQYDFKTAALHELGHAHQLGHVIDSDVVMHYSLGAGDEKYVLDQDDIDGAVYTMGIFTQSTGCGNIAMTEKLDCCDPITLNSSPQDDSVGEGSSVQFSASASDYDSVQWYVSTDGGTSYSGLSDDSNYSGTTSTTLTISNTPISFDGYMYAAHFTNVCSETEVSNAATLTVLTYTAIPDSNFEAALEALGYDDISGDGQVPTSLIESITGLDVQYSNIADLTGIEDFAALEFLQVRNNSLTTLDLSANTALVTVAFRENSIATLDISNSPNVTDIYGAFNNLTTLDLSNNTQLSVLALRNNSISILDLSVNTSLREVNLRNNPLTNVDLRNGTNTNLTTVNFGGNSNVACIQVDDEAYSTTNWTNIGSNTSFTEGNYCRYTAVPDANFEAALEVLGYDDISADGQVPTALIENVTSLIIAENNINDTTGLEDFVSLTELEFFQSGVPALNLSNNTLLEIVNLYEIPLTSLDLSALTNLKQLIITGSDITSLDITANTALISIDASDNALLTSLDLRNGNNIFLTSFDATNNANLTCISVDDLSYSNTNWSGNIDSGASFTETDYCAYTAIPDVNFEAALDGLNYDDILGDGQVPTALIEGVTSLNVDNEGITDLTGIEDFAALTQLNISDSNIPTVDLSNNTNLIRLEAYSAGLTSLDISQNTNLQELIAYSNSLTTLNTSTNLSLTYLQIYQNAITSLDLTANIALDWVEVHENQLTELNIQNGTNTNIQFFDASSNSNLSCIRVDDAAYSTTNWTDIDAQTSFSSSYCRYTSIPDSNFETALETLGYDDISNDGQVPTVLIEEITSLNVWSSNITDVTGIEDFVALTSLNVGNNSITMLDVSNNVLLESLSAQINSLSSIDLSANLALTTLNIHSNSLTTIDLSVNTALEYLEVARNDLATLDLANNPLLTFLGADENNLVDIDLSNNTVLEELELNDNQLTSLDLAANTTLLIFFANNNSLTTLDLSDYAVLEEIYVENNNLSHLNVQNGNNTAISFFEATNNPNLTCILVDDASYSTTNWTTIDATSSFSDTYCRYTAIPDSNFETALETLGYDDISGDGQVPTALIEVLTSLDVRSLNIADLTGIEDFIALEQLYCSDNNLTSLDTSNLVSLQTLWALVNNLTSIDLTNNTALTDIRIEENNLTAIDVSNQTGLVILQINQNQLTSLDVSNNPLITRLRAQDNTIATIDLSNNTSLSEVRVQNNALISLNIQNGNNTNISTFEASSNEFLDCILVDDATYSTTNWTSIDAATSFSDTYCRYTAIPDSNFEATLETLGYDNISGDNQVPTALIEVVTTLNVSSSGITDLTGIEDFTALTSLTVSNNSLGTLVLTNSNLASLDANNCNLTSIDVSQNSNLEILRAHSNSLTSIDVSNNTALTDLNVYGNQITTIDVSTNPLLDYLDLFQNQLTTLDISNNLALRLLFCDNNDLTTLDLSLHTQLTTLDIANNELVSLNVQNGNNTNITVFRADGNADLTCILVDDATYSTTNWTDIDVQTSFSDTACTEDYTVAIDVFLQGAALNPNTGEENLMRDDLRIAGLIPTTSPYADALTCDSTVFDVTGNDAIVDWVLVEVRDATDNTIVTYSQSALLQRDGDVVDVDGTSDVVLSLEDATNYIAVRHRNHLGVMTISAATFASTSTIYNISFMDTSLNNAYGSNAQTTSGMPDGVSALWCGNTNEDTGVQYSGTSPDTPNILSEVLNDAGNFLNFPTYSITAYSVNDVNMDGIIQYSGTEPDTPYILQNILAHPSNFFGFSTYQIDEQVPSSTTD